MLDHSALTHPKPASRMPASLLIGKRRQDAILRVARYMRENLEKPLDLEILAGIACCSRFHLVRIFADQTGVTPMNFLSCIRIQAAKALLLQTDEKIIDIAYSVGFSSLGSFGRRFTQMVGLSPGALREGARHFDGGSFWEMIAEAAREALTSYRFDDLRGEIEVAFAQRNTGMGSGYAFIGSFDGPSPYGTPQSCTIAAYPGRYRLPVAVSRSPLTLLAAGFPAGGNPTSILLSENLLVGFRIGIFDRVLPIEITLDQQSEDKPPVLLALPLLLQRRGRQ